MGNDPQNDRALAGVRVLVVEDEYYFADDLRRVLQDQGAEIVGPAGRLAEASRLIETEAVDCVILDINLRGDMSFAVADRLDQMQVPYVIATGYNGASLPERFSDAPILQKPVDARKVAALIPPLLTGRPGKS